MTDVNKRLMKAAKGGLEVKLKSLLMNPGFDALSKDVNGVTALMHAALRGHEGCVRLLLPVSDALARNDDGATALMGAALFGSEACVTLLLPESDESARDRSGLTASAWARKYGHEILAQSIDAYTLAQQERAVISIEVGSVAPGGRAAPRL